ncbi:MAG: RNA methyltransferase [Planctomycetes bacterium]|nr:RNA methyltransferase [Planctomycetota bacterium]
MTQPTDGDTPVPRPKDAAREYFVACPPGLDGVVAGELAALGATDRQLLGTGVRCMADAGMRYRANLWLRAAIRVLEPVLKADTPDPKALYEAVRSIDWSRYMSGRQTLSVDCRVQDSALTHSKYAALTVKDAIVDQFRDRTGSRPNVDTQAADLPLHLYVHRNRATLSLDTSGTTLHKRGYRGAMVRSPLNEALAAGILYLTRWDRASALADPMCGSGTLPIEAAMLAARRAPGLLRTRFPFEGWPDFDAAAWSTARAEARALALPELPFPLYASDHHAGALDLARQAARAAGVEPLVRFTVADVGEFAAEAPLRMMVLNPPYGERLDAETDLPELYRKLGGAFRRFPGATAWVLSGNASLTRFLGMRATKQVKLLNGTIECRLLRYEVFPLGAEPPKDERPPQQRRGRKWTPNPKTK